MSQRRRWVLEVHFREQHPGISAESIIGPSPLSIAAAASSLRRARSRREKEAIILPKPTPSIPAPEEPERSEPEKEPEQTLDQNTSDAIVYDEEMEEESSQSSLIATLKKLEKKSGQLTEIVDGRSITSKEDKIGVDSSEQPNIEK